MIHRLEIRNYQSLHDVKLVLGRFTVIVGASSSGKSALIRACRTLASNARGTTFVSHGSTQAAITAVGPDWKVTLERGTRNEYSVAANGTEEAYAKLGGSVPERVTEVLRIAPMPTSGASINFAGQFDRPYLLDDSGQAVARTLGELTNVNIVFEAAREANRRRLSTSNTLKTRRADLDQLRTRAAAFATLAAQTQAVADCEHRLTEAAALDTRRERLSHLVSTVSIADSALAQATTALDAAQVPDLNPLLARHAELTRFTHMVRSYLADTAAVETHTTALSAAQSDETQAREELASLLTDAGHCPTCGATPDSFQLATVV